jgi:prevent-host-death family protein
VKKVSAFEAKTKLSELLRETEKGASFVICRRGKEVAMLVPHKREEKAVSLREVLSSFREIRKKVKGDVDVRELIQEGRRY